MKHAVPPFNDHWARFYAEAERLAQLAQEREAAGQGTASPAGAADQVDKPAARPSRRAPRSKAITAKETSNNGSRR